jgi:hypothetical protein
MLFVFEITETLQRTVAIEAEDEQSAYCKVSQLYHDGEIILDASHFIDSEIDFQGVDQNAELQIY